MSLECLELIGYVWTGASVLFIVIFVYEHIKLIK